MTFIIQNLLFDFYMQINWQLIQILRNHIVENLLHYIYYIIGCFVSIKNYKTCHDRSELLGLAGMVKITHTENESFNRLSSTEALQTITQDTVDAVGKRFFLNKTFKIQA